MESLDARGLGRLRCHVVRNSSPRARQPRDEEGFKSAPGRQNNAKVRAHDEAACAILLRVFPRAWTGAQPSASSRTFIGTRVYQYK